MRAGFQSRISAVYVGSLFFAALILGRAAYIQLWGDSKLERLAKRQFRSRILVSPRRGLILDRTGEPLAINVETKSVAANPKKVKRKRETAQLLSKALGVPVRTVLQKLSEKKEFVWIKRHAPDDAFKDEPPEGIWLVKESKRVYPHNEVAAHVLGSVSIDSVGVDGIEYAYNARLEGKVVALDAIKDALGRPAFIDAASVKAVKDGEDIRLSIDTSLQYSVEQELKAAIERHGAASGTVVVMDATNGEMLALANQPSFNPNFRGQDPSFRRNRALTDSFEPGSTIKPILLASALSNGLKLEDRVHGNFGKLTVQGKTISEAETHERFAWITLEKMIQVSSNVGSAKLALQLGSEKYLRTLRSFGFGSKTGAAFPGEATGALPQNPATVQPLTLANIGFGQGMTVNAVQIARAYAAILNGGVLVEPTFFLGAGGSKSKPVLSSTIANQVMQALSKVTQEGGTGTKARLEGYDVAGKTGTAQMVDPTTKRYSKSRYLSSFVGFALNVKPKIVIFTSLEGAKGVYYASETAAPLFREVLRAVANRFSLPVKPGTEPRQILAKESRHKEKILDKTTDQLTVSQSAAEVATELAGVESAAVKTLSGDEESSEQYEIPSFVGLTPREALQALEGRRLRVSVQGFGFVRTQSPHPGTIVKPDAKVELILGEPQ